MYQVHIIIIYTSRNNIVPPGRRLENDITIVSKSIDMYFRGTYIFFSIQDLKGVLSHYRGSMAIICSVYNIMHNMYTLALAAAAEEKR